MKTYSNLWEDIIDFENLLFAYKAATKGKRYNKEVLLFSKNLEENIITIQNELLWRTWEPKTAKQFYVYEPKKRAISAPQFTDRVVHHALVQIIEPLFENKFIKDSYACRRGKGTHNAVLRTVEMLKRAENKHNKPYFLKADISSYFPSVHHLVLKEIIRRTIRDKDTLWLIDAIIDSGSDTNRGIPIGSLTSQLFANVYLDVLDHKIKDDMGVKNYVRYMDDFVIIHGNKGFLKDLKIEIEDFLHERLCLKLNPKTTIQPVSHGIDFCGYRIFRDRLLPRKRNMKRSKRRLKKLAKLYKEGHISIYRFKDSLMSFLGYTKHCKAYHSTKRILDDIRL